MDGSEGGRRKEGRTEGERNEREGRNKARGIVYFNMKEACGEDETRGN